MICDRYHGPAGLCEDCKRKYIVEADQNPGGDFVFFCFDTEAEAWAAFNQIETTNGYAGLHFIPRSAVLLHPREEKA